MERSPGGRAFSSFQDRGDPRLKPIIEISVVTALALGLLGVQAGCSRSEQEGNAESAAASAPVPAGMVRGTVIETMDSGGYTYVQIETDTDKRWMASRQIAVKVSDVVQANEGMPMQDFTSQTLDRTFQVVYFVDSLQNLSSDAAPAALPHPIPPAGHPPTGQAQPEAGSEPGTED